MSNLSPKSSMPSDTLRVQTTPSPPPYQIPPEISKFHLQNGIEVGLNHKHSNNHHQDYTQTPSLNNKNPFCIEALLAKNRSDSPPNESSVNDNGGESEGKYYLSKKYKEHIISRNLNDSPDENMSR